MYRNERREACDFNGFIWRNGWSIAVCVELETDYITGFERTVFAEG